MNTHNALLAVQYITVSALFVEIWIVFLRWRNTIHSYLFFHVSRHLSAISDIFLK